MSPQGASAASASAAAAAVRFLVKSYCNIIGCATAICAHINAFLSLTNNRAVVPVIMKIRAIRTVQTQIRVASSRREGRRAKAVVPMTEMEKKRAIIAMKTCVPKMRLKKLKLKWKKKRKRKMRKRKKRNRRGGEWQ